MFPANQNAYNQYRTTAIQTASPGRLLIMLYDGLLLSLKQAKEAIDAKNSGESHRYLVKAQDIVDELMISLNMDYEISHHLYQLYDFWKYQLVQANIKKDHQTIDSVLGLVAEMRETWASVVNPVQSEAAGK